MAGTRNMPEHPCDAFEWLAHLHPEYEAARRRLASQVWAPEQPVLAVKYREIIAAVILGYRTYPSVDTHLRRALAAGATLREILEGFEAAAILGGFTMLHYTLPYMIRLHEEFGDTLIDGPNSPKGARSDKVEVEAVEPSTGPVSRGMREWAWLNEIDPQYDNGRREITSFVWTPKHPALPVKIRELAASAVLAYRAFPTVDGHLRRAVREGASLMELIEAMEAAALPGGLPVLHYALPYLMRIGAEIEAGTLR